MKLLAPGLRKLNLLAGVLVSCITLLEPSDEQSC